VPQAVAVHRVATRGPRSIGADGVAGVRYLLAVCALWIALQYSDDPACLVINACLLLLPWFALAAISGRWQPSLGLAALIAIALYAWGELKFDADGTRLAAGDFALLLQPSSWRVLQQDPLYDAALGALALALLMVLDAFSLARRAAPMRWPSRVLALIASASLAAFCGVHRHDHAWDVFRGDADCGDLHECGVAGRILFSLGNDAPGATPVAPAGTRPDIVVWLNESTVDPRMFKLPGTHLPRLRMFEDGPRTVASGALRVRAPVRSAAEPVALAPASEEFGAGRSLVFEPLPSRISSSLVRMLKAQGYHTMALLPAARRYYGADSYAALGVDQVVTLRDFPEYDAIAGDEWDLADSPRLAEAALSLIQRFHAAAGPGHPLFLYLASTKEHGPYSEDQHAGYDLGRAGLGVPMARRLSDYIGRLRLLDIAVTTLEQTLARQSWPTLFCWFGDHPPDLGAPAPYRDDVPFAGRVTQYQVTANFPVHGERDGGLTDLSFLPSVLVDLAGVPRDRPFAAMSTLRRACEGRLDDCADVGLVRSYQAWFRVPQAAATR
jgi:hypothetical protein